MRERTTSPVDSRDPLESLRFETLISELSRSFINVTEADSNHTLEAGLRRIVETLGFDRSAIYELGERLGELTLRHSYTRSRIEPIAVTPTIDSFPWYLSQLARGEPVVLARIPEDLPDDAVAERNYFVRQRIHSDVTIPLMVGGRFRGLVSFGSFRIVPLPDALVQRLRLIGEIFASALARLRDQERLHKSEERYRALVENAPEAIVAYDLDSECFVEANENAVRLFGWSREELFRMGPEEISPQFQPDGRSSREYARELLQQALDGEEPVVEWTHMNSLGRNVPCEIRLSRIPSSYRKLIRGSMTDITARKALEEQLRQSQKMEALGRLAGGIAHDFNNLLTALKGHAELALEEIDAVGPAAVHVREIVDAGERASGLTSQLLAFSRSQMSRREVLDVNVVVGELSRMIERLIGEDIETRFELDDTPYTVDMDRNQLEQIVVNLAVNARDAMPRGGTLTVATQRGEVEEPTRSRLELESGHYVVIDVWDTGSGIDPEIRPRIFEPFFTTKDPGQGTGLGLSTVYGNVRRAGGRVRVESRVGVGTMFRIYLPESQKPLRASSRPKPTFTRGVETVLLVEDEEAVRTLACIALRRSGYTVLEAADGEDALRTASEHDGRIDLLVSDVIMPGMGGPELAEKLVESRPDTAVLFVSGYAGDHVLRRGVDESAAFLSKPYTPTVLARCVRELLDETTERRLG